MPLKNVSKTRMNTHIRSVILSKCIADTLGKRTVSLPDSIGGLKNKLALLAA